MKGQVHAAGAASTGVWSARKQHNRERPIHILIGCNEPLVVDALRLLLASADQHGRAFEFTSSRRCDEFIQQAQTGGFDLAVMYPNCLFPTPPFTLLEHSLVALKKIKASGSLKLVVLTSMEEWLEPLRAAGADLCVKMPFDANELRGAISTLV